MRRESDIHYRFLSIRDESNSIEADPLSIAAHADLIVSGDKHLLGLGGHYQGIPIVTPAQAVQRIAG